MTLLSKLRENPSYYDQVKWAYTKGQVDDTEYLQRAINIITDHFRDEENRVDHKYQSHALLTRWEIDNDVFTASSGVNSGIVPLIRLLLYNVIT